MARSMNNGKLCALKVENPYYCVVNWWYRTIKLMVSFVFNFL